MARISAATTTSRKTTSTGSSKPSETSSKEEVRRERKRKYNAAYYAKNTERVRAIDRTLREAHPERYREYKKTYRAKHRKELRASGAVWYLANREKRAAKYMANREERRAKANVQRKAKPEKGIAWRTAHRAELRAYNRRYRLANLERDAARSALRRARAAGADGSHTTREWLEKCALFGHLCAYCGEAKPLERDHVIPLTRGGSHFISNIVPACRGCNGRKHNKTLAEFLAA